MTTKMNRRQAIRSLTAAPLLTLTALDTIPGSVGIASADTAVPDAEPYLMVEKTRFAMGEQVFFWVGVQATEKSGAIPEKLRDTCRLTIIRPDGTRKIDPISWPKDSLESSFGSSSWAGGCGLQEPAVPGQYTLVFEFAGKKTAPATFVVERAAILSKIYAEFVYGAATGSGTQFDRPVTLTVRNNSDQVLRFPYRSGFGSPVSCHFLGRDKQCSVNGFYPADKLRDPDAPKGADESVDTFTWEAAKQRPAVVLKPGETYRLRLSLRDAVSEAQKSFPIPSGRYDVQFETLLQILIGDPEGVFATLSPVRLPVETTALCTLPAL